jgi:hypothetical protein
MNDKTTMMAFNAITSFVEDLSGYQGSYLPLQLYSRLLKLTKPEHHDPIHKHVEAFRVFCVANQNAILEQDISKVTDVKVIKYSTNVYLDVPTLFASIRDSEDQRTFWVHMITIYGIINQSSQAKEVLKTLTATKPASLPALPDLTEMMADMQNGQINGGKLMSMLHTMIDSLSNTADESTRPHFDTLRNMIPTLDESGNPQGPPPDPTVMISAMMNIMPAVMKDIKKEE